MPRPKKSSRDRSSSKDSAAPHSFGFKFRAEFEKLAPIASHSLIDPEFVSALEFTQEMYNEFQIKGDKFPNSKDIRAVESMIEDIDTILPLYSIFHASGEEKILKSITLQGNRHFRDIQDPDEFSVRDAKEYLELLRYTPKLTAAVVKFANDQRQKIEDQSEAPAGSALGRIAFAGARKGMPFELDTDVEKHLFRAIDDHFDGHMVITSDQAEMIRKLISKELYADVFHPPTESVLYRGMGMSKIWLKKAIKVKGEIPSKGQADVNFTFTPKRGASSWTSNERIAARFGFTSAKSGGLDVRVVLHATVDNNTTRFVTGVRGLYDIGAYSKYRSEKESIGLGPIRVSRIDWRIID